ncbi:hypothetical protein BDW74DRAFT_13282 [Aspergillus multicolor]|uniref:RIC1 family protein n=1 Tax=Aspergillus multicolor TaxID=41759 RepID=UPI003CCD2CAA
MYWPNGVPRVYAINGPGIPAPLSDDAGSAVHEDSSSDQEQIQPLNQSNGSESHSGSGPSPQWAEETIRGLSVSRNGHMFATMTESSIAVWQTRPTAVVAAFSRSATSLETYGSNIALMMRPDATILVVQTQKGYLLTYTIATDANSRVYQQQYDQSNTSRRQQLARLSADEDASSIRDVSVRFRMAIKIESGIVKALALDNELVVATAKPAAIQCIRWTPDEHGTQTQSELLSRALGVSRQTSIIDMVYDRAINLMVWVTNEGHAYAVQRMSEPSQQPESRKALFNGHCFHTPISDDDKAIKVTVNARFSLLTVSCANGNVLVYTAKDYLGNVPLSHKLQPPASSSSTGNLTFMCYAPDGYCLFAGYEHGWTTWSVFGKPGGNSFSIDRSLAESNGEDWLTGTSHGCWIGGGSDIILTGQDDRRIWILETARSALTGCYSSANLARGLLQTGTEVIMYRGHDLPDLITISGKDSLWHHAQYPPAYLHSQWPIRSSSVSQDGRYVAIAGKRGLAHYSVNSGRWKVFEDSKIENSFAVRGGMCWYGHILIAAIDRDGSYELCMFSRELPLNNHSILHIEYLPSPVVFIGPSGEDSLLVYTYENILYHYIINSTQSRISLVPVGQIAFNGIVRAPTRVRSISWVLPEEQLQNGDPSQDVKVASVLLLVDGNLVLLQPSMSESGDMKYDMRVISHDVEYYILMRDQHSFNFAPPFEESLPPSPAAELALNHYHSNLTLRDSLWTFSGKDLTAWGDVQDVLQREDVPMSIEVPLDFYPLSVLLTKGIVLGVEPETIQRRDVTFVMLKYAIRTHLFLPYFLQHSLVQGDIPAAHSLCQHFSHLSYFPHALEILLHHVLDDEVDNVARDSKLVGQTPKHDPLLPSVISFLQASLPTSEYLDIVVQCTRKTELRSWRTLFAYLPAPKDLFEQALKLNSLKTAVGYLLVLQAFEDESEGHDAPVEDYVVRLMILASRESDWELCAQLVRFLVALDGSGEMLRRAVSRAGLRHGGHPIAINGTASHPMGLGLAIRSPSWSTQSAAPSISSDRSTGGSTNN